VFRLLRHPLKPRWGPPAPPFQPPHMPVSLWGREHPAVPLCGEYRRGTHRRLRQKLQPGNPAGAFSDPQLPPGNNVPFNIKNINGKSLCLLHRAERRVNVFNTEGQFIKRFATGGNLLNPWGMAVAPPDFGTFSNALLIGNFNGGNAAKGPGYISAYNLTTGDFLGLLKGSNGAPLNIDGLWELVFGNGGSGEAPTCCTSPPGSRKRNMAFSQH